MNKPLVVVASAALASCASLWGLKDGSAEVHAFLDRFDHQLREISIESNKAAWVQATHITEDTQLIAAKASERTLAYISAAAQEARHFDTAALDASTARQLNLLRLTSGVPTDGAELAELTQLSAKLEALYGSGQYCREETAGGPTVCRGLGELEAVMRESHDPAELLDAWQGWRSIAPPMKADYTRFAALQNVGARELGFADAGAFWRSQYDMPAEAFEAEVERLWQDVRPLYEALHCHVRAELGDEYGRDQVPEQSPITAHLLGNMWAQSWENLYPRITPYPGADDLDVTAALVRQKYDAVRMVKQAEGFYTDLGLPALPESFYRNSMLTKPADRDVVCHASAWDIDYRGDVRIKMCIEPDEENLRTIYHELGHIYYDLAYNPLPLLFQSGAHDGFHEAIGDTMVLSLTADYMKSVGLVKTASSTREAIINQQLKMALEKVAFLPFGLLVDKWRWKVFSGDVSPEQYNAAWWELKREYQGVDAPGARPDDAFDPAAKYHIPANTPYMRYFLAHILQFQFYEAMCSAAGHQGPLNECSFAGSKEAGAKLWALMQAGQSQPWPETLSILTGGRQMSAEPLLAYFAPLKAWLDEQNAGRSCGW